MSAYLISNQIFTPKWISAHVQISKTILSRELFTTTNKNKITKEQKYKVLCTLNAYATIKIKTTWLQYNPDKMPAGIHYLFNHAPKRRRFVEATSLFPPIK